MKNRFSVLLVFVFFFASFFALMATDAFAAIARINPEKDNSIYEGNDPTQTDTNFEDNTCGAGPGIYAGGTNNIDPVTGLPNPFSRRALLTFDIAGNIPAGATINSVSLTLTIDRSNDNPQRTMTLHPVNKDWGEGTVDCTAVRGGGQGVDANLGDATWISAEHDVTLWTAHGGDFDTASASASVPSGGEGVWTDNTPGDGLVLDVQEWLNGTKPNYGWIVIGDEVNSGTVRRFWSREGRFPPVLTVDFTCPPGACEECCDVNGVFLGICTLVPIGTCTNPPLNPNDPPSCDPNTCPQPIGACCNFDESCSDQLTGEECRAQGGIFQSDGSECRDNSVNCGLEPFVDALPFPVPVIQPVSTRADGVPQYEITMDEVRQQLHRDLSATDVWGYNGSYPGPTLETIVGQPIEVKYINNLPPRGHYLTDQEGNVDTCPHGPNYWRNSVLTTVHLHGGHVPARVDGQPEYTFFPGEFDIYEYPNNQAPATLWYHDHALGITRLNVYMGLAAYYMLRPDCNATSDPECLLPSGMYEVPAVIQDRTFNDDGTLFYPPKIQDAFYGDKVLVNGKVWPYLMVDKGKYRFRFLNGSQARVYKLKLENLADPAQVIPFTLVGTDVGLVSEPITLNNFMMTPAERFDVLIDFSQFNAGDEIILRNDNGQSPILPNIMKFIVTANPGFTGPIPAILTPVTPIEESSAAGTRKFRLIRADEPCANGEWLVQSLDDQGNPTGEEHWDQLDVFPTLGTTEIWEFENASSIMHPMHIHLVKFQILDRNGSAANLMPWEANTWKDTVRVPPNGTVRVIMDFEDYPGRFPFHCHILDHEDHEMMRQFQATWDPALCNNNGECDPNEDCVSCPNDCAVVSGALCGNGLCEIGDGEDFTTCPADCNGRGKGKNRFNCGSTDTTDPGYNCGFAEDGYTVEFDGCITDGYFCRVSPRLRACCGDALCEGQETETSCAVDCAGPAVCTYSNHAVSIAPLTQDITSEGGSVTYTVSITNNDSTACMPTAFDLTVDDSDNGGDFVVPSTLSANSVTLAPAANQNVTLTVTAQPDGTGSNDTSVTASDPALNHADVTSNTVTTTIKVQVNCSDYTERRSCNREPTNTCVWDKTNNVCVSK
jgi:spore coat protein A